MTTQNPVFLPAAAIILALTSLIPVAQGADVVWGTPQNITDPSDVSTNGSLFGAYNIGNVGVPSTTLNGVIFQSFQAPGGNGTSGDSKFVSSSAGGTFADNMSHGSANAPFTALSPAYQTLLQSGVVPLFTPLDLVILGLTTGAQYEFQWWANDSSSANNHTIDAFGGTSMVRLGTDISQSNGGLGQWVIGSFTADSASQNFRFLGDGDGGVLNAFQLRQIPQRTSAVPDSGSTLALLGLSAAGLGLLQRRLRVCG